jgi:uncharacterized membrane protein YcfT
VAAGAALYLEALWQPFGTLWFIYLLPIFFVVTKLTRNLSPVAMWIFAAALEIAPIETGSMVANEFASRFVYFYTGYVLAGPIFALASNAQKDRLLAIGALMIWAAINGAMVFFDYDDLPGMSLALGLVGVAAVVTFSALLAKHDSLPALRYFGRHSIVIYLAFFLPMVIARMGLLKAAWIADVGTVSALVTAAGIGGALAIYWLARRTPLGFLFVRPELLKLKPKQPVPVLQPAE